MKFVLLAKLAHAFLLANMITTIRTSSPPKIQVIGNMLCFHQALPCEMPSRCHISLKASRAAAKCKLLFNSLQRPRLTQYRTLSVGGFSGNPRTGTTDHINGGIEEDEDEQLVDTVFKVQFGVKAGDARDLDNFRVIRIYKVTNGH